jgi:hydrogenase expression/formation protein HypE
MNAGAWSLACPVPIRDYPRILMAHGGGGRLMGELIGRVFAEAFRNDSYEGEHDAALLDAFPGKMAFTTDAFVVKPLLFPGGDVGSLAVHGTANDLAMAGARPKWLSVSFILEEGLEMELLWRLALSMGEAARAVGAKIVTGDTKVVERGNGDGLFVSVAGIGEVIAQHRIHPAEVRPGDAILVSGDIGRHGIAIMASREGIEFETAIESDSAPVVEPALALLEAGLGIRCMRDVTRGGLTAVANEVAATSGFRLEIEEAAVPVRDEVRGACEILGLDPFNVACEGRFVAFVAPEDAPAALEILKRHDVSSGATAIGSVTGERAGDVVVRSPIGARRILDLPAGEQLPRIC